MKNDKEKEEIIAKSRGWTSHVNKRGKLIVT